MNININNLVSISEANQNFSKVARMVEDMEVEEVAKRILSKHMGAFEELAK